MELSLLKLGQPGYPPELEAIPDPPRVLFLRGSLPPPPRVALVGSRDADRYGLDIARALGAELARAGVCVVSGGAGGVDTAALEGCLDAVPGGGGRVAAVLGTGVDLAYPAANRGLFERIAGCGALLSEYPPGTPGHPANFARRNRIVSGLCAGVVVVRAAEKSGSLITARDAVRQGRVLMAVPGAAGDRLSAGVHHLLRRGAVLVENAGDVLRALSIGDSRQLPLVEMPPTANLEEHERKLLEALGDSCRDIDWLSCHTGMGSGEVASLLLQMELKGLVTQKPGMNYCRSRKGAIPFPAAEGKREVCGS